MMVMMMMMMMMMTTMMMMMMSRHPGRSSVFPFLSSRIRCVPQGSSWLAPTFSGYVEELRLMDSSGRLRRFTKSRHPDIIRAAKCGLGMFGILYDITLRVSEPLS